MCVDGCGVGSAPVPQAHRPHVTPPPTVSLAMSYAKPVSLGLAPPEMEDAKETSAWTVSLLACSVTSRVALCTSTSMTSLPANVQATRSGSRKISYLQAAGAGRVHAVLRRGLRKSRPRAPSNSPAGRHVRRQQDVCQRQLLGCGGHPSHTALVEQGDGFV